MVVAQRWQVLEAGLCTGHTLRGIVPARNLHSFKWGLGFSAGAGLTFSQATEARFEDSTVPKTGACAVSAHPPRIPFPYLLQKFLSPNSTGKNPCGYLLRRKFPGLSHSR